MLRRGRRINSYPSFTTNKKQHNLIALWALKVLLDLRAWKKLKNKHSDYTDDLDILTPINLGHLEDEEMGKSQFLKVLKEQRARLESCPAEPNEILAKNCKQLCKYLDLNNTEHQILIFAVILDEYEGLKDVTNKLGDMGANGTVVALSIILDLPLIEVRQALSRHGLLARSGLLNLNRGTYHTMEFKLELLEGLGETLSETNATTESLLEHYFTLAKPPELTKKNYHHVAEDFNLIKEHLQQASKDQTQGVNILVYGPPGTGKSELAKTIAKTLDSKLYEVNIGDEDKPFDKPKRLRAFQLAQQVLSRQKKPLLLFDEIDSLLAESFSFFLHDGDSLNLKAWINKNLENNNVPSIWIANDIQFAESAFIRRFDIVFHLDTPPRSTRLEILGNYLKGMPVTPPWLELLADNKHIAPAIIARAARVVRCQNLKESDEIEKRLEKLLESTLTAMGHPKRPVIKAKSQMKYRLEAVNPDHDLKGIIQGLQRQGEGRLCLYGPPGTGKTEFGNYLALKLNKPLLVKRSSDLLGPYVGQTEGNIAEMFNEATYEKAVLLLDEADSFLRDRKEAQRSWEVTQVNELLTQMENYNGVFVCSTNLIDNLDTASLRRFDLKIKFDFLKPKQAWALFHSILEENKIELQNKTYWRKELTKCQFLTPGDFATVMRKNRISGGKITPEHLLEDLTKEITFKQSSVQQSIGFLA